MRADLTLLPKKRTIAAGHRPGMVIYEEDWRRYNPKKNVVDGRHWCRWECTECGEWGHWIDMSCEDPSAHVMAVRYWYQHMSKKHDYDKDRMNALRSEDARRVAESLCHQG
jgi:hypothetical protein